MSLRTIASVLFAALVVAACGSDDPAPGSTGTSGNAITVSSNKFTPASIAIKKGEKVTWTWAGGSHDVVSGTSCTGDGKFKSSLQSSGSFEFTFNDAGTFPFFCTPHCSSSNMVGTVIVQ